MANLERKPHEVYGKLLQQHVLYTSLSLNLEELTANTLADIAEATENEDHVEAIENVREILRKSSIAEADLISQRRHMTLTSSRQLQAVTAFLYDQASGPMSDIILRRSSVPTEDDIVSELAEVSGVPTGFIRELLTAAKRIVTAYPAAADQAGSESTEKGENPER